MCELNSAGEDLVWVKTEEKFPLLLAEWLSPSPYFSLYFLLYLTFLQHLVSVDSTQLQQAESRKRKACSRLNTFMFNS
jgi:hypothetical protein